MVAVKLKKIGVSGDVGGVTASKSPTSANIQGALHVGGYLSDLEQRRRKKKRRFRKSYGLVPEWFFKVNECHEPGGSSIGGQFCSTGGSGAAAKVDARTEFRTSKGTNKETNAALVKESGVKVVIHDPRVSQDVANEAVAHVVNDPSLAKDMKGVTVQFKDMGTRVRGNSSGNLITLDSKSVKEGGPGMGAGILRHELEHTRLGKQGVPSIQQESRVQHAAGNWAVGRYANMAKTNPTAAAGFKKAAIEQGIKGVRW